MAAIHQFVAGFRTTDAISNEALLLRAIFRKWGYESEIFCEGSRIQAHLRHEAHNAADYVPTCKKNDVLLLHLSIGSVVNDIFADLSCRKAILYHNITPAEHFDMVQKNTAASLRHGRTQMKTLSSAADVVMADSAYNARELTDAGYQDVKVLPLILELNALRATHDRRTAAHFNDGLTNVLFVGRGAPNKCIEDILLTFFHYNRSVDADSRLIHVGSWSGLEQYKGLVMAGAQKLGLSDVAFLGSVSQEELNAAYRSASVFLCMSEHEGFCIPLIESMVHDVPIVAYAAGAVPETLDGAGVLFGEKDFPAVAEMMGRVVSDTTLRAAIIRGQRERLRRYEALDHADMLRRYLQPVLE